MHPDMHDDRNPNSWLAQLPWADIEASLNDVEEALRRALAVLPELGAWEEYATSHGYADEFSLSEAEIDSMPAEARIAYAGQLVADVALRLSVNQATAAENEIAPVLRRLLREHSTA